MKVYTIKDIDGNVMYQRQAPSKKAMIERLVLEKMSLARADLRGDDLEHLNLSFGDFTDANLDGAKLTGCKAKKTRFDFASMRGTACDGISAPYASFIDAKLLPHPVSGKHTSFVGGVLPYTHWDKAKCLKVDWSKADICSSTFAGSYLRRCNFFRAQAHNAEWVDSNQFANNFDKAVISPRMKNTPEQFLPDRTKDAIIVGNSYKGTVFAGSKKKPGEKTPVSTDAAFIWDKRITALKNHLSTVAITGGLIGLGSVLPMDVEGMLQGSLGSGIGFIATASVAVLAKDKIEDLVKGQASDRLTDLDAKVREVCLQAIRRGKSVGSLATALMSSKHADILAKVIHDPGKSILGRFKAVASGEIDLLVCDRKHLAEGLSRLSEALNGRLREDQDVVMTRSGFSEDGYDVPNIIVMKRDGRLQAVWGGEDGTIHRRMEWNSAGLPTQPNEDIAFMGPYTGHRRILKGFADAIANEAGVPEFNWNPETHVIRRGRNDSVVVLRKKDNRMDNPDGPAIVSKEDEMFYFRNASQVDEFGDPVPPPPEDDEPQYLRRM
ncbi:pentapeptide repeat-containing protein [Agrobacterium rubi]|nr:pentapeptide repeat-containing protein [Agrobacterium rubi]NTF24387.1 pentapeptide repeat-containing protein [Agrobacterium rubi]